MGTQSSRFLKRRGKTFRKRKERLRKKGRVYIRDTKHRTDSNLRMSVCPVEKGETETFKTHSHQMFPDFYLDHPRPVSVDTILANVESGALTGFVQVDIRVPEKWPAGKGDVKSAPMIISVKWPPIFCNSEVHFNEWGPTMQNYSISRSWLENSRTSRKTPDRRDGCGQDILGYQSVEVVH